MSNYRVEKILFTLVGLTSLPAFAETESHQGPLRLIEDLPEHIRPFVHEQVVNFLSMNPQVGNSAVVAMDAKGVVYVLDNANSKLHKLGEPTCVVTDFSRNGNQW